MLENIHRNKYISFSSLTFSIRCPLYRPSCSLTHNVPSTPSSRAKYTSYLVHYHEKISNAIAMGFVVKSLIAGLVGATAVSAQCVGPPANAATVDLVADFEGFEPDICE